MKIIHFTKSRPMQYRAFLESFLYNTNPLFGKKQFNGGARGQIIGMDNNYSCGPITTIISGTQGYEDIIKKFNGVRFVDDKGENFDEILREEVNSCQSDYLLAGCDDEIVLRKIDLNKATDFLDNHPNCIGFSLRLGLNIDPLKYFSDTITEDRIMWWKWRNKISHYSYPFEYMATIYPTWIVKEIVNAQTTKIKTPNFSESFGVNYCINNPNIPSYMACFEGDGSFVALDINRIQTEFENKTQNFSGRDLSPENLLKMYKEGYRIDWKKYQGKVYDDIFIGDTDLEFVKNVDSD